MFALRDIFCVQAVAVRAGYFRFCWIINRNIDTNVSELVEQPQERLLYTLGQNRTSGALGYTMQMPEEEKFLCCASTTRTVKSARP